LDTVRLIPLFYVAVDLAGAQPIDASQLFT
jgi:hypothetical protein